MNVCSGGSFEENKRFIHFLFSPCKYSFILDDLLTYLIYIYIYICVCVCVCVCVYVCVCVCGKVDKPYTDKGFRYYILS